MRAARVAHVTGAVAFGDGSEHIRESGAGAESLDERGAAIETAPAAAIAGDAQRIEAADREGEGASHARQHGAGARKCKGPFSGADGEIKTQKLRIGIDQCAVFSYKQGVG
jgi:hypothetical protein